MNLQIECSTIIVLRFYTYFTIHFLVCNRSTLLANFKFVFVYIPIQKSIN